jgi:hypothetical protein
LVLSSAGLSVASPSADCLAACASLAFFACSSVCCFCAAIFSRLADLPISAM